MPILAIDPGNVQSAYVLVREDLSVIDKGILPNEELLALIPSHPKDTELAIEMVASYGMAVGKTVFDTVFWIGQFYEAAKSFSVRTRVYRIDVKMHLCHSSRAKDANIRQALIDRFGEVGTQKKPGWFYGFAKDLWAAYAVAVYYRDSNGER